MLDQPRRTVEPGTLSAAWGDPTITLKCGVEKPPGLGDASECFEVNGVGWFAEEAEGGYLFTTIGRSAYVQVGVPTEYAPEANALVDVAEAVKKTTEIQPSAGRSRRRDQPALCRSGGSAQRSPTGRSSASRSSRSTSSG